MCVYLPGYYRLLQANAGYYRLLQVIIGYYGLLVVTTCYYRLINITTGQHSLLIGYYRLLQITTGYYSLLYVTKGYILNSLPITIYRWCSFDEYLFLNHIFISLGYLEMVQGELLAF